MAATFDDLRQVWKRVDLKVRTACGVGRVGRLGSPEQDRGVDRRVRRAIVVVLIEGVVSDRLFGELGSIGVAETFGNPLGELHVASVSAGRDSRLLDRGELADQPLDGKSLAPGVPRQEAVAVRGLGLLDKLLPGGQLPSFGFMIGTAASVLARLTLATALVIVNAEQPPQSVTGREFPAADGPQPPNYLASC